MKNDPASSSSLKGLKAGPFYMGGSAWSSLKGLEGGPLLSLWMGLLLREA